MVCLQSNVHILPKLAPASWGYRWDLEEGMGNLGIKAASFISMHETKKRTALKASAVAGKTQITGRYPEMRMLQLILFR